ncbi:hypothetical protein [Sporomusa sp.]|uniref:hypothetical protein n=1 Tax=Sporomusa sp. TaxID=2078658 RepID=UPI002C8239A5|nr:hypothetical protein [Sporomusa sp.]MDF2874989.1 hypothetical protein [Sporomusa sp.]HWR09026.1 hypothetical protein [Sporomusa sp.]
MNEQEQQANSVDKIEADFIIVEVTDKTTGKTFRRNLPVRYLENDNGIVLYGETMDAAPSQISLLSEAALAKLSGLLGRGPDQPRCS